MNSRSWLLTALHNNYNLIALGKTIEISCFLYINSRFSWFNVSSILEMIFSWSRNSEYVQQLGESARTEASKFPKVTLQTFSFYQEIFIYAPSREYWACWKLCCLCILLNLISRSRSLSHFIVPIFNPVSLQFN